MRRCSDTYCHTRVRGVVSTLATRVARRAERVHAASAAGVLTVLCAPGHPSADESHTSMRTHIARAVCERERHGLVEAVRRDAADIERALLARGAGEERALEDEAVLYSFLVSACAWDNGLG
jgi:hypothetical protein